MKLFNKGQEKPGTHQQKAKSALKGTRRGFWGHLKGLMVGQRVDEAWLDALEEILIRSDVGVETSLSIIDSIEKRAKGTFFHEKALNALLREEIISRFASPPASLDAPPPHVTMMVGVNGAGKTTSAAKLAYYYQKKGDQVLLGACDTFRAAAVEQLQHWGTKLQVPVVALRQGADPASVAYETVKKGQEMRADRVIIDTSGRLHNNQNLMRELQKIHHTLGKKTEGRAPHEVLLTLDGTSGQNAFAQTRSFHACTPLSGLLVSKLDGSSKGGMLIGVSHTFGLPVRYLGVGEGLEDLVPFDAQNFVQTLFEPPSQRD